MKRLGKWLRVTPAGSRLLGKYALANLRSARATTGSEVFLRHQTVQRGALRQLALLGAMCALPSGLVGLSRSVAGGATVAGNLPADGRGSACQPRSYSTY